MIEIYQILGLALSDVSLQFHFVTVTLSIYLSNCTYGACHTFKGR